MIINWNKFFGFLGFLLIWQIAWLSPHFILFGLTHLKKLSSQSFRWILTATLIHAPIAILLMSYDPWMGTVAAIIVAPVILLAAFIAAKLHRKAPAKPAV